MKQPLISTVAAGLLIALASVAAFRFGGGTLPLPILILLVIPLFVGLPLPLVVLCFVGVFWAWCSFLFRGEPTVPRRTIILLYASAVLSLTWFALNWQYGVRWQGLFFTVSCLVLSIVFVVVSALLMWRARTAPSFVSSLITHTVLFAWLASYAFPLLGETP